MSRLRRRGLPHPLPRALLSPRWVLQARTVFDNTLILLYPTVYARLQPDIDDRIASYENYCQLFNLILNSPGPVPLSLPIDWLYNMYAPPLPPSASSLSPL